MLTNHDDNPDKVWFFSRKFCGMADADAVSEETTAEQTAKEAPRETKKSAKGQKVLTTKKLEKFLKKQNSMGVVSNVALSVCLFAGVLQFYAYIVHSGVHQSSPTIYETCEAQTFALAARRN